MPPYLNRAQAAITTVALSMNSQLYLDILNLLPNPASGTDFGKALEAAIALGGHTAYRATPKQNYALLAIYTFAHPNGKLRDRSQHNDLVAALDGAYGDVACPSGDEFAALLAAAAGPLAPAAAGTPEIIYS